MNPAEATRQICWNISHIWVMYALLLPTLAIAGYGVYRRVSCWRRGLPLNRHDRPTERIKLVIRHAVSQIRTAVEPYTGLFHSCMVYGFLVLAIATTVVALDSDFGTVIMRGRFYLYFQSLTVDIFGALATVGAALAAARRFLGRPKKLVYTKEAAWILVVVFAILATGFMLEGWRIAVTGDPWGSWSPVGYAAARLFQRNMSVAVMSQAHLVVWWLHLVLSFGFLAWLPYTKMLHVLTAPLNIYTANLAPMGAALKNVDFERSSSFGVNTMGGFTWKDLLDLDACTECGRCTLVCPANTVGKELSPRDLILQLRDLMHRRTREVFGAGSDGNEAPLGLVGSVPAAAHLWQCTTCAACMQACPVFVEQMPKIVDMRRYLVMEQSEFPDSMQEAITSLETRAHPFRGTQSSRLDWTRGLNAPLVWEVSDPKVLLWVGCSGALLERSQKVTRATALLLEEAGVRFGILGREEKCCGDPARVIGNEFLFERLAKDNISLLKRHKVEKIITPCPHCFNAFRNVYPQYGGEFEVYHHSEYLALLVREGRLKVREASGERITFHDPCYLGRHNGTFEQPRELVQKLSGLAPLELGRSRANSFCCGGGGGMSFAEEPPAKRVNRERARETIESGADILAVACPFCMTMMEDGIAAKNGGREVRVLDIAELLHRDKPEVLPKAEDEDAYS